MPEQARSQARSKTIPDQINLIAEESEGGASRVMDQVEICINNFEEIKVIASKMMESAACPRERGWNADALCEQFIEKGEELLNYADNGLENLEGILDLYQYQDIIRQKLEKVGHQLIDVSDYIRKKLVPDVSNLVQLPPTGQDIFDRNPDQSDAASATVAHIVAQFQKTRA